jgi:uncharacterized glyoxalase superfamily protein PhnB
MKIKNIVPMLATGDMEASIRFYREALGFELRDKFESGGRTWWCELSRDGRSLMLTQHEVDVSKAGARESFAQTSINVYLGDGIEALHERLEKERRAVSELRVTFYGMKEFDLKDPAGYTVLIGQATDEAPTVVDKDVPPF